MYEVHLEVFLFNPGPPVFYLAQVPTNGPSSPFESLSALSPCPPLISRHQLGSLGTYNRPVRGRADRLTARDHLLPGPAIAVRRLGPAGDSRCRSLLSSRFVWSAKLHTAQPNFLWGVLLLLLLLLLLRLLQVLYFLYGIGQPAGSRLDSRYQLSLSVPARSALLDFARSLHTSLYMPRQYRQALF